MLITIALTILGHNALAGNIAAQQAPNTQPPVLYDIYTRPTAGTNIDPTAPAWLETECHAKTVTYKIVHPSGTWFSEEYATSFWPTTVISKSDTEVLVAGKTSRGFTLIELWEFESLPLTGWANGQPFGGGPGNSTPIVDFPRVINKTTLYFNNEAAKDIIKNIVRNRALPDHAFVEFDASEELWDIDLTTGFLTLVASPTQAVGPFSAIASLDEDQFRFTSNVHSVYGGMYRLARTSGPSLIFTDANNDGLLDGVLLMTPALWASMNLSDPSLYTAL